MSRYNIFKVVREELGTLKSQLEKQKQQLEKLKVTRQERIRREEALALSELRRAVETMQHMDTSLKKHEQMLIETVNELERQAKRQMEGAMQKKAADILQGIDYERILSGDVDVEQLVAQQQQQQAQQRQQGTREQAAADGSSSKAGRALPQRRQGGVGGGDPAGAAAAGTQG
ncbi:hypothetical protein N2152v2_003290 [Parachlorella kessleri]